MDRLAFTAAQGIAEKAVARQLMTNELANVSTVGFKRSYDVALQAIKVEGSGFDSRFEPRAIPSERVLLDAGQLMATGRHCHGGRHGHGCGRRQWRHRLHPSR
jgi:flagellar basal-body rod protein FlgF